MQSAFPPVPPTRLDVVMWFLRIQLWLFVVILVLSLFQPIGFVGWWPTLRNFLINGFPVLVLALFASTLALGALGHGAREPVNSGDLRFLVGRCVGLALFVGSLGHVVGYGLLLLYNLFPNISSAWAFGTGVAHSFLVLEIVTTAFSFFLGFALAFGPAIRNSFRAR